MHQFAQITSWLNRPKPAKLGIAMGVGSLALVHQKDARTLKGCQHWKDAQWQQDFLHYIAKHQLEKNSCHLVLSCQDYQTFLVEKPKVSPQELSSSLKWRLADLVDQPLESFLVDYIELPQKNPQATEYVYVIAAMRSQLERHMGLLEQAQLHVTKIEVPETALLSLFAKHASDPKPYALIGVRGDGLHLQIYKQGQLLFVRHFELDLSFAQSQAFSQELAVQIQRSLDYCSTIIAETSHAKILFEAKEPLLSNREKVAHILGLSIEDIKAPIHMPDFDFHMLSALCSVLQGGKG